MAKNPYQAGANDRLDDFLSMLNSASASSSGSYSTAAVKGGGTAGHDHLVGTTRNDAFNAGGSGDAVAGMAGNDKLSGGSGDDKVWGGSGNDTLNGGGGADLQASGRIAEIESATCICRFSDSPKPPSGGHCGAGADRQHQPG